MNIAKRLSALLAAAVALALSHSAMAERPDYYHDYNDGTYTWTYREADDGVELCGWWDNDLSQPFGGVSPAPSGKVTVPATVTDECGRTFKVTGIEYMLFKDCAAITEVVLPDTVKSIGYAFTGCDNLAKINVPAALEELDADSFDDTAWYAAQTGDMVMFGGFLMQYRGTDDQVVIPEDVKAIANMAFYDNDDIEAVTIPVSVLSIGSSAFEDCEKLATVKGADGVVQCGYEAFAGTKAYEDSGDLVCIANIVVGYKGDPDLLPEDFTLDIPDGAAVIAESAFDADSFDGAWKIAEVNFPDTLRGIGIYAFYECTSIESVTIPESVVRIEDWAFESCNALETVDFDGDMDEIDMSLERAFAGTPWYEDYASYLIHFDIDGGVLNYVWAGDNALWPDELDVPEGVVRIAEYAFEDAELWTVNLPSTLERIDAFAFQYTGLEEVNGLTDSVDCNWTAFLRTPYNDAQPFALAIEDGAVLGFTGACPKNVAIPEGVTSIAESAFDYDAYAYELYDAVADEWIPQVSVLNLETVSLPSTLTEVGEYAFYYCTNLQGLAVANTEFTMGIQAFAGCMKLAAGPVLNGYILTGWDVYTMVDIPWCGEKMEELGFPTGQTVRVGADFSIFTCGIPSDVDGTIVTNWLCGATAKALWEKDTPELFEGEDASAFEGGQEYTGWLRDSEDRIVGIITVKAAKPKNGKSKLTATVTMLATGKKQTFKGEAAVTGGVVEGAVLTGDAGSMTLTLSGDGVTGTFGEYTITAGENVFASKDDDDKAAASIVQKGTWIVTLDAGAAGYVPFTLAVGNKGRTKVSGVLPDGSKVSLTAQAVVGDGDRWCVPVAFSKKAKFGFVAWFQKDASGEVSLAEVSDVTPLVTKSGTLEWTLLADACGTAGSLPSGTHWFSVKEEDVKALAGLENVFADTLPTNVAVAVAGGKWVLGKAAKVSYKNGALSVLSSDGSDNAAGVKLTFKAKTGAVGGSFTIYSLNAKGKLAKTKFTVSAAVVNGACYGSACNKKVGSLALTVK